MRYSKEDFLNELEHVGALKFGSFELASGNKSEFYLDLRYLPAFPKLFSTLMEDLKDDILNDLDFDVIVGIPTAGVPFATALALITGTPLQLLRKKPKSHGMKRQIEGPSLSGKTVLLVDDLISSGFSKEFAISAIQKEGAKVRDLVVLVDRSEGKGKLWAASKKVELHVLFQLSKEEILTRTS